MYWILSLSTRIKSVAAPESKATPMHLELFKFAAEEGKIVPLGPNVTGWPAFMFVNALKLTSAIGKADLNTL
jgi:hypothetical protein